MTLKFDEIVFAKEYELKVHKHGELKVLNVKVSLLDEEARELSELIQNNDKTMRPYELLFTDQLEQIQELLVGVNFTAFATRVVRDFGNFTLQLIQEVVTTEN